MAAPRKKRRVAERNESSSDSDESENSSGDEYQDDLETIEVDFDVKFPESTDRHGIKTLLQQLFLKAHINISELADVLIEQSHMTGVIKEAEDDDEMEVDACYDMDISFGVFSVINLTEKKEIECIKQIRSFLLTHCKSVCSNEVYETFNKILNDNGNHVGLIISERLVNIPAKIAVPLYGNLSREISQAKAKEEPFDFLNYILICKIVVFDEGSEKENVIYTNAEEEIIAECASMSYDFSVSDEQDSGLGGAWTDKDDEGRPKRRVLVLPASSWDTMYNKLTAELGT